MKRIVTTCASLLMALTLATPIEAASTIRKVEYDGRGKVEVSFAQNVSYQNASVSVKDASGKAYSARIVEKDNDDLEFHVSNIAAGTKYNFTINGVRVGASKTASALTGNFSTPSDALAISKTEFDAKDNELDLSFSKNVIYKNAAVTVKDATGNTYTARIIEKDNDDMEVRVSNINTNGTYTVSVSGIALRGTNQYVTLSKDFTVRGKANTAATTTKPQTQVQPQPAATLTIRKAEFDAKDNELDLSFSKNVSYKNAAVTVKDAAGKAYTAKIIEKDNDDMDIRVSNISANGTYTVSVSGVALFGTNQYVTVSKNFVVKGKTTATAKPQTQTQKQPATTAALAIKKVEYDLEDKELDIDFNKYVQYNNVKVTVTDSKGNNYSVKLIQKDKDDMEAIVFGLANGATYNVTVSGIREQGKAAYTTLKSTFTVKAAPARKKTASENINAFVTRSYRMCLNRNPENAGLNYWTSRLQNKQETAASTVNQFFNSNEMKAQKLNNAEYIERCYNVMMNRSSDKQGKQFWMNQLANGKSKKEILNQFLASNEFSKIANDYNITKGTIK